PVSTFKTASAPCRAVRSSVRASLMASAFTSRNTDFSSAIALPPVMTSVAGFALGGQVGEAGLGNARSIRGTKADEQAALAAVDQDFVEEFSSLVDGGRHLPALAEGTDTADL